MPSWPHVRAALIALLLFANGLIALPFGPRVTRQSLAKPEAQAEIRAWMRAAGPLGFTKASFEAFVIDASNRLVDLDHAITAPFSSFLGITRTGQSWGLFAVPDADPMAFTLIGVDGEGVERVLYRRLDGDHTFLRGPLDYRRVRGIYDIGGPRKSLPPRYQNLAKWAADQAFDAFPDLQRVIVVQTETHTTLPGEPPDTRVAERHRLEFDRADR